jgi:hypothetical protein
MSPKRRLMVMLTSLSLLAAIFPAAAGNADPDVSAERDALHERHDVTAWPVQPDQELEPHHRDARAALRAALPLTTRYRTSSSPGWPERQPDRPQANTPEAARRDQVE